MVRARGSAFRDEYKSHGKQFVRDLPIRSIDFANAEAKTTHDRIVQLVEALIRATERAETALVPLQKRQAVRQAQRLHQAVQKLVGELYGITTTDLAAVGYGKILEGEGA
jgi:hypothetical protein